MKKSKLNRDVPLILFQYTQYYLKEIIRCIKYKIC